MRTRTILAVAGVAAVASIAAAPAPAQQGEFCYDLDVTIAGTTIIDEEGCQESPELPAPPALPFP